MNIPYVRFTFESELNKVKEVLRNVLNCVKNQFPYISETDLFDLRLVYSELLVNAVVHGNGGDTSKKVELILKANKDEVFSVIRDEGNGFNYAEILKGEDYTANYYKDHGRGLRLVNSLTEQLNFNNTGNEIKFYKKISR